MTYRENVVGVPFVARSSGDVNPRLLAASAFVGFACNDDVTPIGGTHGRRGVVAKGCCEAITEYSDRKEC
jgi:hypothetical protein